VSNDTSVRLHAVRIPQLQADWATADVAVATAAAMAVCEPFSNGTCPGWRRSIWAVLTVVSTGLGGGTYHASLRGLIQRYVLLEL
jgi:hypothetical protein